VRPRRILMLTMEEHVPPESTAGLRDHEIGAWKTEYDVRVTLEELGHDVTLLGIEGDFEQIQQAIRELRPHIVVNLLEKFGGTEELVPYVLGYLELVGQPYTGCGPLGMMFSNDKARQRKVLRHHRIAAPDFAIVRRRRAVRRPPRLEFPLIVKSLTEHGSAGIAQASVVTSDEALADRVAYIHDSRGADAIVEQFIEGRELYVGILGNERLTALPVWELSFQKLREGAPQIATERLKWDTRYQRRVGVRTGQADLDDSESQAIQRLCKRAYRVLEQTGYARMDLRMDPEGRVYLIESNPNPQLSYGEDFAEAALASGLDYPALLERILRLGVARGRR
jgi:D-alanine-D-alanine ligase